MNKRLFPILLSLCLPLLFNGQIKINEIMQSNIDCVFIDHEFPDSWVELYNPTNGPKSLYGYKLGDTEDITKAFALPSVTINPYSHIVIYCDKVDSNLHTDFRLDSGKGELFLFNRSGNISDHISYKKMPAPNVAYGRENDNSETWGYMINPTPGGSNSGGISSTILPEPIFSFPGKLMSESQILNISIPNKNLPEDTKIYYTIDGCEPTSSSPSSKELNIEITKNTIIKAKLISTSAISPRSTTNSYIFHPRNTQLPIISLSTDINYFYDSTEGIWHGTNYWKDWRRPIHFEYFEYGKDKATMSQLCETRTQGGWTRQLKQKSLALYANKRFGTKRFAHTIWKDKPNVLESKSIVLRNGGNDFDRARIRDAFVQTLFGRNVDNLDWQGYQPCVYYINGQYMGVYDIRERSNEDYVEANYNGLEDIDMFENWDEIKAGTWDNYNNFKKKYLNFNTTYEELITLIDEDNFMKMFIASTWAANTDFPGNNIVMWRPREVEGKWRWLLKDMDFVGLFNAPTYNYLEFILRTGSHADDTDYANTKEVTAIFRNMISKPEFKEKFINHFTVYLGDFLRSSATNALLTELMEELEVEYPHHLDYWQIEPHINEEYWIDCVNYMRNWSKERSNYCYTMLRDYFGLGNIIDLTISSGSIPIKFNGISLVNGNFNGKTFADRNITLEVSTESAKWEVTTKFNNGDYSKQTFEGPSISINPTSNNSSINIKLYNTSSITSITNSTDNITTQINGNELLISAISTIETLNVYNLSGQLIYSVKPMSTDCSLTLPSNGVYIINTIDITGNRITKKIIY